MSFNADQTNQQVSNSMGAFVLLHASNQALIEADVAQNTSSWYPIIMQELGNAEDLVVDWRQSGFLYFQQEVLEAVITAGQAFVDAQPAIDAQFDQLSKTFDPALKAKIVASLKALETPLTTMDSSIGQFLNRLKQLESDMQTPLTNMEKTAADVQAQAAKIQSEINSINAKIANLQQQIKTDREAIAKAKAKRKSGIIETIFGVVFAPFTGGVSLILAGIGVASIVEGEDKIHEMQNTISKYQGEIASDTSTLNQDERQIATLHGLTLSLNIAVTDMQATQSALDSLRTTFTVLVGSIDDAAKKVDQATTAKDALLEKVFFDASVTAWKEVVSFCQTLAANNAPTPTRVQIG